MDGSLTTHILAESRGLGDLIYLLIFLVFPALNALGKWIRERSAKKQNVDDEGFTIIEQSRPVPPRKPSSQWRVAEAAPVRGATTRPVATARPGPAQPSDQPQVDVAAPAARPARPTPASAGAPPAARRVRRDQPRPPTPQRSRRPVPAPKPPGTSDALSAAIARTLAVRAGKAQPARRKATRSSTARRKPSVSRAVAKPKPRPAEEEIVDAVELIELEGLDAIRRPTIADLRKAIIMNEVLGKPMALRGPHSFD